LLKFKTLSEILPVDIRIRRKVAVRLVDVDDSAVHGFQFFKTA
jgi:hypothetical protein